jgi:serine/threonine-protein kinase
MAQNPAMLARFHGEVRIARQVSHQNACRVYDIGEFDEQLFLSMEYVDGEDLASLLKRIGRLPSDKAIEFSRKLCAGLAAAHDRGVLHRDLKPANIMIDSEGRLVIMDFGLAAVAAQIHGQEILAGTPAYMAPEQLAGREVTVRSDIYSLGLVLYEMFTGRRPFEGTTLAEMIRLQEQSSPASLTTVVKDVDPAVERTILRCLAPDPKNRPGSALAVAAALPGGDPLAAALAAGETPSPELVAASGEVSTAKPLAAISWLLVTAAGLISIAFLRPVVDLASLTPMDLPPDALMEKARETARSFGYTNKPADWARGFYYDLDVVRYLRTHDKSPGRWTRLNAGGPEPVVFWYRESPRPLELFQPYRSGVATNDPPVNVSGMTVIQLDQKGRMLAFQAVPPQVDRSAPSATPPDWRSLFVAAGLDPARFSETAPAWTPPQMADSRAAWEGSSPDAPGVKLRIEAAAWRGKPVNFDIVGPWSRADRMEAYRLTTGERLAQAILLSVAIGVLVAACLLARYNLRRGRGDRRGASRLAAFAGGSYFLIWVFGGAHVSTSAEFGYMFSWLAWSLVVGGALWMTYLAIEPYVRRHWPQSIVSWTRLVAGGLRDPLVGRDVLIGTAFGMFFADLWALRALSQIPASGPNVQPQLRFLLDTRHALSIAFVAFPNSFIQLLVSFFLLFICRVFLRKQWMAAVAFVALSTLIGVAGSSPAWIDLGFGLVYATTIYVALTRFGFVTYVTAQYIFVLLLIAPMTSDMSVWYAGFSVFVLLLVAGLAAFGLHSALRGRSIIEDEIL